MGLGCFVCFLVFLRVFWVYLAFWGVLGAVTLWCWDFGGFWCFGIWVLCCIVGLVGFLCGFDVVRGLSLSPDLVGCDFGF